MPHTAAFEMIAAGLTDVGRMRVRNEDCLRLVPESGLALVCDGMGGHAGGDVASRKAVESIAASIMAFSPAAPVLEPRVRAAAAAARSAVLLANRRIHALNQERGFSEGRGMGTTVVGLWQVPGSDRLVVFHAGDSRLYRLRAGALQPLTRDHSLYQMWIDNGRPGAAPHRNIIVRALGTGETVEPDIHVHRLEPDDLYLLCSDGLNGMVPDAAIARILDQEGRRRPEDGCARLVDAANQAGGNDNITVIIARFAPRP